MKRRGFLALVAACVAAPLAPRQSKRAVGTARAPSEQAVMVNESWGLRRNVSDLTDEGVTGTWGAARRIPGQHLPGSDFFGPSQRAEKPLMIC